MTDPLLQDLMCRLMEPALLIDSRRKLVFATESFNRLIGRDFRGCSCDHLLLPSFGDEGEGLCCWDVLDEYLALKSSGLWMVKRANGSYLPALCTPTPVDIAGTHSYIHLHVRPLSASSGVMDLICHSMRAIGDGSQFESWIEGYLRNTWGVCSEWIELTDSGTNFANVVSAGLDRTDWSGPFDVRLPKEKRSLIQRVFPPERTAHARVLVVKAAKGMLREELVMAAWAAARAANRQDLAFQSRLPVSLGLNALSAREWQVLTFLAEGKSDKEIASQLHRSVHTVKNHVRHIMSKSGIHKRVGLATLYQSSTKRHVDS